METKNTYKKFLEEQNITDKYGIFDWILNEEDKDSSIYDLYFELWYVWLSNFWCGMITKEKLKEIEDDFRDVTKLLENKWMKKYIDKGRGKTNWKWIWVVDKEFNTKEEAKEVINEIKRRYLSMNDEKDRREFIYSWLQFELWEKY